MKRTYNLTLDGRKVHQVIKQKFPNWTGLVEWTADVIEVDDQDINGVGEWLDETMPIMETLPDYNQPEPPTLEERLRAAEDALLSLALGG